jgi:hypothetical protein
LDILHGVEEVQDEKVFGAFSQLGCCTVETAQGLHGHDALQFLVHVHGAKLGLVVSRQVLVGDHKQAVGIGVESIGRVLFSEAIQAGFGVFDAIDCFLA